MPDHDPTAAAADGEQLLRGLRAVGTDDRRCVRIEFDGAGDVVGVEVTSQAQEGNRGKLETSIRQALVAATAALREVRAEHAEQLTAAATAQIGDLTASLRDVEASATARFDEALGKIAAAAARMGR